MITFESLPFEIILLIAESSVSSFTILRYVYRDILNYTNANIQKYKLLFSSIFEGTLSAKIECMDMNIDLPLNRHYNKHYNKQLQVNSYDSYNILWKLYPNKQQGMIKFSNEREQHLISYFENKIHGSYEYRCENREIKCVYELGKPHGTYIEYFKGKIYKIFNYDNGMLSGKCLQYSTCSQNFLEYECNYFHGELHGCFRYWKQEFLRKEDEYYHDEVIRKRDWKNGILQREINYKEGKIHGEVYLKLGNSEERANFRDGVLHGNYCVKNLRSRYQQFIFDNGVLIREVSNPHRKVAQYRYFMDKNFFRDGVFDRYDTLESMDNRYPKYIEYSSCTMNIDETIQMPNILQYFEDGVAGTGYTFRYPGILPRCRKERLQITPCSFRKIV